MPSRRFHKKSRTGCSQCRGRRIKCNEATPTCGNCSRANLACQYSSCNLSNPMMPSPKPAASPAQTISIPSSSTFQFDLLDLYLMNHFTLTTPIILLSSAGSYQRDLWQKEIPKEARSNALLMHGLLSVSALHLAQCNPAESSTYQLRALHHHNLGLQLFNDQIGFLCPENSHVLFAFAFMLAIWAYASSSYSTEILQLDEMLHLLDLVRGGKEVFMLHMDSILDRPIGNFIQFQPQALLPELPTLAQRSMQELRGLVRDGVYTAAIDRLESLLKRSIERPDEAKFAMAWPATVEDGFWERLKIHEPVAVLIFMHYALILQRYEGDWWWVKGWSTRIIVAAEGSVSAFERESLGWDHLVTLIQSCRLVQLEQSGTMVRQ